VISFSNSIPKDPLPVVHAWMEEARNKRIQPHPNAITIASVDVSGKPSARVVLIKDFSPKEGYIVFHTHYKSRKSLEFVDNPWAAGVVHWDHLGRQIRFEGLITKSPDDESNAYFATRDWRSQLNAWTSEQSQPISDYKQLLDRANRQAKKMNLPKIDSTGPDKDFSVQRPPFWGGFRMWFCSIEFWIARSARFHERIQYKRSLKKGDDGGPVTGPWHHQRLQP